MKSRVIKTITCVFLAAFAAAVVFFAFQLYNLNKPLDDVGAEFEKYTCPDANLFFEKGYFQSAFGLIYNFRYSANSEACVTCWRIRGVGTDKFIGIVVRTGTPPMGYTEPYVLKSSDTGISPLYDWSVKKIRLLSDGGSVVCRDNEAVINDVRSCAVAQSETPRYSYSDRTYKLRIDFKECKNIYWQADVIAVSPDEIYLRMRADPHTERNENSYRYSAVPNDSNLFDYIIRAINQNEQNHTSSDVAKVYAFVPFMEANNATNNN